MTSTSASETATAQSAARPTMASSSSLVTRFIVARAEWKVYRCPVAAVCRANSSGSSVSMVVLELGTMRPIREEPGDLGAGASSQPRASLLMPPPSVSQWLTQAVSQGGNVSRRTPTVRLVELSPEGMAALVDGDLAAASAATGVELTEYFTSDDCTWLWRLRLDQLASDPAARAWVARAAVD